jgi:hypothetical protein
MKYAVNNVLPRISVSNHNKSNFNLSNNNNNKHQKINRIIINRIQFKLSIKKCQKMTKIVTRNSSSKKNSCCCSSKKKLLSRKMHN